MLTAILRAQLLSMRLRVGTRRGGAVFSGITGLMFYGMWTMLAFGVMVYFADPDEALHFDIALPSGLLFVAIYWQFAPIISASPGASLDIRKLLVYPIPRRTLFAMELMLRLTTCAEMFILLGAAVIGLLRNPLYGFGYSPFIVAGAVLFAAANILGSAGTRNVLERVFLRRRLKEIILFLIAVAGLLPQILIFMNVKKASLLRFAPTRVIWPWTAAARLMLREHLVESASLCLFYCGLACLFAWRQFERGFTYDPGRFVSARPLRESRTESWSDRCFRLPSLFLSDPVAAIVEKELRTFMRMPRFRLVYAMSCFFGIIFYLPSERHPRTDSFFQQNALPIMALYGLLMLGQISYWNSFGFDRAAIQGYFLWPIRFRDVLVAKNGAVALLLVPQILIITVVAKAIGIFATPAKMLETAVVMLIASLYWFAVGNIVSVRMPRAMDPDKMNQMSNKIQALSIWTAPFLLLPIGLAYWSRAVFGSEMIFGGILLVAAIIGVVFYWVGLDSAASAALRSREAMLVQLARSEGPISVT